MSFRGEKLNIARNVRGMSIADLASRIGVSRQYAHQIETGAKSPSKEVIADLCRTLYVNEAFFEDVWSNPVSVEHVHFRKLKTAPVSSTQQTLAYGTIFERFIYELESYLRFPPVNFPDIQASDDIEIEQAAVLTRRHWGVDEYKPLKNVTKILENSGAVVTLFETISSKVDALSIARRRPIVLRSLSKQSVFRQRFDLAHECAHLVIHQGLQSGDPDTESQAHRFAGALLLPRKSFVQEFPKMRFLDWDNIFRIKLKYGISAAAVVRRGYDLGVLSQEQYKRANIHLSNTGQRRVEKFDHDYELEEPKTLKNAISVIMKDDPSVLTRISQKMGVQPRLLRELCGFAFTSPNGYDGEPTGNVVHFPPVRQNKA